MRFGSVVSVVAALGLMATPAFAQKSGGIMKMYFQDNPPSASAHWRTPKTM